LLIFIITAAAAAFTSPPAGFISPYNQETSAVSEGLIYFRLIRSSFHLI